MQFLFIFLLMWYSIGFAWFGFKTVEIELYAPDRNRPPKGPSFWEWPLLALITATLWPYAMRIYLRRYESRNK